MRAESTGYARWEDSEKERLRKLHSEAVEENKSHVFFEKLTAKFGNRSYASVAEECRRLGLKAKKNPRAELCSEEDCKTDLSKIKRIGDKCIKCYNKNWWKNKNDF